MGIVIEEHMGWAKGVAIVVAKGFGFSGRGQEIDEVIGTAYLTLCDRAAKFNPPPRVPEAEHWRLFRGWACRQMVSECRRECLRLQNGGMYSSRREREHEPLVVSYLTEAGEQGEETWNVRNWRIDGPSVLAQ